MSRVKIPARDNSAIQPSSQLPSLPLSSSVSSSSSSTPPAPSTPTSSNSAVRVTLEDFEWGSTLGEGSYGTVSLATLKTTGQKYAVKVLNKRQLIKENKVESVSRERKILNSLNHPYVVKLFFAFQDAMNLYFVMEMCPGGELYNLIRKYGAFNLETSIFYAAEIVLSLEYIHTRDIIHRDLKPENILLTTDMHVKLIDFGTAKEVARSPTAPGEKARAESFCGTAEYVSPELLNEMPASASSDLWALGCIIYQCITGRPPFKGKTQYQTFQLVNKKSYVFPTGFPTVGKDIIDKLLVMDPNGRLGAKSYDPLKCHNFFKDIKWNEITTRAPPPIKAPTIKLVFPNDQEAQRRMTVDLKRRQALSLHIHDLPDDFLFSTLSLLSLKDLLKVSAISKKLNQVTTDKRLWDPWFKFYLKPLEQESAMNSTSIESELEDIKFSNDEVIAGSVNKLVDFLVNDSGKDYSFKNIFLFTYQTFMKPQDFLLALFQRYNSIFPFEPRLLRLVSILKTWIDNHFEDFDDKMLMAIKIFMRGKVKYDARPAVIKNLGNSLEKKLRSLKVVPTPRAAHSSNPSNMSWTDITPLAFAEQLTLLDFTTFRTIRPTEYLNQSWRSDQQETPNVSRMIDRFNQMTKFVPTAIVSARSIKDRIKVTSRLIHIAQHLRELKNFSGLMAFLLGFNNGAVARLRFTLDELPKKDKKILGSLQEELQSTEGVAVSYKKIGDILLKVQPPCVPYMAMIFKDLKLIESQHDEDESGSIVNFKKRRQMYNVISMLGQYTTYDYRLKEVPEFASAIQSLQVKDDNATYQLSLNLEPRLAKRSEIL